MCAVRLLNDVVMAVAYISPSASNVDARKLVRNAVPLVCKRWALPLTGDFNRRKLKDSQFVCDVEKQFDTVLTKRNYMNTTQ